MRDLALMWMETHYAPFAGLLGTVRSGDCAATDHYGQPFFGWLADQPEQVDRFSRAMANLTDGIKAGAIASYDFTDAGKIVDLGAADGALLAKIISHAADTTGIVFDLPHVVSEAARRPSKAYGLGERLTAQGGRLLRQPCPTAPTPTSCPWSCTTGTTSTRPASSTTSAPPPRPAPASSPSNSSCPTGTGPHMSKMIDLTMLGMLNGRERTDAEMRTLFEGAGLVYDGVVSDPDPDLHRRGPQPLSIRRQTAGPTPSRNYIIVISTTSGR